MAPRIINGDATTKRIKNKGAWSAEEDRKLAQCIEIHGAKRWKTVALKSGLNRCGKSCRLRWLNYLRPNIKRGDFSNEEEDLILRLHKLLGNRWSLIAGRLPGRTDNEIKNYWNSHLRRKINQNEKTPIMSAPLKSIPESTCTIIDQVVDESTTQIEDINFDDIDLFDFSIEGCFGLDWVDKFLELEEDPCLTEIN